MHHGARTLTRVRSAATGITVRDTRTLFSRSKRTGAQNGGYRSHFRNQRKQYFGALLLSEISKAEITAWTKPPDAQGHPRVGKPYGLSVRSARRAFDCDEVQVLPALFLGPCGALSVKPAVFFYFVVELVELWTLRCETVVGDPSGEGVPGMEFQHFSGGSLLSRACP